MYVLRNTIIYMKLFGFTIIRTKKLEWLYTKLAELATDKIKTPRK